MLLYLNIFSSSTRYQNFSRPTFSIFFDLRCYEIYNMIMMLRKGGVFLQVPGKKLGRPTDSPKTFMLRVKMDKETLTELDECCKVERTNRSEFVRRAIHEKYSGLKK